MMLFLIQSGVAISPPGLRETVVRFMVFYSTFTNEKELALFAAGMLVAQLEVIMQQDEPGGRLVCHSF